MYKVLFAMLARCEITGGLGKAEAEPLATPTAVKS